MLRRSVPIILILLIALFVGLVLPATAQDAPTLESLLTNTPAPESTVVTVTTVAPIATNAPVTTPDPIIIEQPQSSQLSWLITISPLLVAMVIAGMIVLGILGRAFIIQLGSSVPIAFYEITRGAAVAGLDSLGNYVTTTATTIDDAGYSELRKLFDELKAEIEVKRQEQAELIQRYLSSPPPTSSAN